MIGHRVAILRYCTRVSFRSSRDYRHLACLSVVTTILCLLVVEAYCAFTYRPPFPEQDLLIFHNISDFTPPLNAEGFRQAPVPAAAMGKDTTRILFLGDSFTFAHGLKDGTLRFTSLLEKRLNAESILHYHIYNAGVGGTEPHRWVDYLDRLLPLYKPNIVFAVFFLRDGTNMKLSLYFYHTQIAKLRKKYTGNWLYAHSYLARVMIDHHMISVFNERYYRDVLLRAYVGTDEDRQTWTREQRSLERLAALCAEAHIPFHLIIFPALYDLNDYPFQPIEDAIFDFAHKKHMPVTSLTSGFLGKDEHTLWVGPGDQHPNARGHEIAADTLYPYLKLTLETLRATPHPGFGE
jgi:hypothetical protein